MTNSFFTSDIFTLSKAEILYKCSDAVLYS